MHLKLVAYTFNEAGRRLRPSARPRLRLSSEVFDAYADFACLYAAALQEARLLSTWTPEKEEAVMKSFFQKQLKSYFETLCFLQKFLLLPHHL